jgi:cell division transport system ATP-binding protein
MKTLLCWFPLTEGEGHIVDFDLDTLKEDDIPFFKKIGIVFQDFKLLPDRSIKDNMLCIKSYRLDWPTKWIERSMKYLIK